MLAIIGGSGFARLAGLGNARREVVRTPYGDPSCALTHGEFDGRPIVFLARHGYGHTIAPHEINYRANVWALRQVGVTQVVAVATVGGIRPDCVAGCLVVPDQLVDYTWGRRHTFFEGADQPVTHIDITWPYDAALRVQLLEAARRCGAQLRILRPDAQGRLQVDDLARLLSGRTRVFAVTACANATGERPPYEALLACAAEAGALTVLDAAQAVSHEVPDLSALACDFMAFSSHKMYGPMGSGALAGRRAARWATIGSPSSRSVSTSRSTAPRRWRRSSGRTASSSPAGIS